MLDISSIGLGEMVNHKTRGFGMVIKCTEHPSILVEFKDGKKIKFTGQYQEDLKGE